MKTHILAGALLAGVVGVLLAGVALTPGTAAASERAGDAALGAIAGAVVAGPVGLVGGGIIGYTAGPGIASEWGLRHRHHSRPRRAGRKAQ